MKSHQGVLRRLGSAGSARIVYCPHAGGGAGGAQYLRDALPKHIELWGVQLPGREDQINAAPFASLAEAATAVSSVVHNLPTLPTVLFGHSMGAIVAYETAHLLTRSSWLKALMVCGHNPPQQFCQRGTRHQLDDAALIHELRQLGGTPSEVLYNSALMQLVLPVLRQDFALLETWCYQPRSALDIPIIAMAGKNDSEVDVARLAQWQALSRKGGNAYIDEGAHFYLFTQANLVVDRVQAVLNQNCTTLC